MPPKKPNYKSTINLVLGKLKNGDIQKAKVDLSKINKEISKTNWSVK